VAEETKANPWERNRLALTLAVAAGIFALAAVTGRQHYFALHPAHFLPFHTAAEMFSIVVSLSVFAVGLYAPREEADPRIGLLSAVFLAVGLLDLLHNLSYAAMPALIVEPSANRAALFWIGARAVAAAGFLAAALAPREWLRQKLQPRLLYPAALLLALGLTWLALWQEAWLPAMFVPGRGLTAAKVWAEFAVIALMIPAAVVFAAESRRTGRAPATQFTQAIIFLVFGELAFTLYWSVFDIYNLLGHVFKVLGYFYIFQAAYVANVRRPYEDLQRLVGERTGELERTLAELRELDKLKDEFISGVSHDLRTPLVPLRGFLDMILAGRAGPLNPRQEEFLDHCRRSVERQAQLIDELLDYGRLRAGRLVLEREVFDLREVIQDALRVLEQMAMQRGLRMEIGLPEVPLPVEADRTKLLRVFSNLFSNAVKFNSERGLVRVEAVLRDAQVAVSVEDTGPGIDPADQERVFERFWQASRQRGGSGIGLWMVREIVRLHGGRVDLSSEPGRGSRFTVYLDGAAAEAQAKDGVSLG
jgi:signal transduction histidine kinase